ATRLPARSAKRMAKWDFSSVWRSPRCTDPGADEFACTKKTRVRSSRNPAPATPRRILRVRLGHRQPLALFLAAPTRSEPFARPASFRGAEQSSPTATPEAATTRRQRQKSESDRRRDGPRRLGQRLEPSEQPVRSPRRVAER